MIANTEKFYQDLGSRIREARINAGISQEILAVQLDLTRASIINLEKGRHRPSIAQLIEIANLLMVNFTDLIPYQTTDHAKTPKPKIDIKNSISSDPKTKKTQAAVNKFILSLQ